MKYFYFLYITIFFSCNRTLSEEKRIEEYLEIVGIENPQKVLIIYIDGCTGCFSYHRTIIEKAKEVGDYQIILVTKSKKKARLLFGEEFLLNTYFDTNLVALDFELITGFPTLLYFDKNGDLIEKSEIDYGTNSLHLP
jgi:thioredoxin-related protein